MTVASVNALEERDRLRGEIASCRQAVDLTARHLRDAESAFKRTEDDRLKAYGDLARGMDGAQEKVDEIEERHSSLLAEIDRARAANEGAHLATRAAQNELDRLYHDRLADFAKEAEVKTQEAREALLALRDPYARALRAWQVASAAWSPLAPAIHQNIAQSEDDQGVWHDHSYRHEGARVPAFPVVVPQELFDRTPRPPAMRKTGEVR